MAAARSAEAKRRPVRFELDGVAPGARPRFRHGLAAVAALILIPGCFYNYGAVPPLADGRAISFGPPAREVTALGRVPVVERAMLFGGCDQAIHRALGRLFEHARARGANRVQRVRFRARSGWISEPVCRRNLNYAWLLVPALLSVPMSVSVRGEAVFDPRIDAARARPQADPDPERASRLCWAFWPEGARRAECRRLQAAAYERLRPAIDRVRRAPRSPHAEALRACYAGAQLSHGTDWVAVERCAGPVPAHGGS